MHQQIDPLQLVVSERLDEEEKSVINGQEKERIEQFRLDEEDSESERVEEELKISKPESDRERSGHLSQARKSFDPNESIAGSVLKLPKPNVVAPNMPESKIMKLLAKN